MTGENDLDIYRTICELSKGSEVEIEIADDKLLDLLSGGAPSKNVSLKMKKHKVPKSIKMEELQFLKDFITENALLRGYEIATGFGIGSLAIGLGHYRPVNFLRNYENA